MELSDIFSYFSRIYKDEKPSVYMSVGLSALFRHALSSVVSTRIAARYARNEAPVFGDHFKKALIAVVRHLRSFECHGVEDSC